jgi:hypothetical protein
MKNHVFDRLLKYAPFIALFFVLTLKQIGFAQETGTSIHEVVVLDVKQVRSYTYLLVSENNKQKWVAGPSMQAEIGDVLFYKGGTEMSDFKSKELSQTFSSVLFLEKISNNKQDLMNTKFQHPASDLHQGNPKETNQKLSISIKTPANGISIADLLKNKNLYAGKTVIIKGQVTKFNSKIMSKNWVHFQDGTVFQGEFDLTLTTNTLLNVGDIVVLKGEVSLEKDFGYGYFYKIIVENAQLIKD